MTNTVIGGVGKTARDRTIGMGGSIAGLPAARVLSITFARSFWSSETSLAQREKIGAGGGIGDCQARTPLCNWCSGAHANDPAAHPPSPEHRQPTCSWATPPLSGSAGSIVFRTSDLEKFDSVRFSEIARVLLVRHIVPTFIYTQAAAARQIVMCRTITPMGLSP
jgi:hypothetical protein